MLDVQDFAIAANGNIAPPNKSFPTNQASITFRAAGPGCALSFPDTNNCFGQQSVPLAQGLNTVAVTNAVTTDGTVEPPPSPTAQQNPDTFEITFGN